MALFPARLKTHHSRVENPKEKYKYFHKKEDQELYGEGGMPSKANRSEYHVGNSHSSRCRLKNQYLKTNTGEENLFLIIWAILTKETLAASRRILTMRSSNCSTTSSHKDFPEADTSTSLTLRAETLCFQRRRAVRWSSVHLQRSAPAQDASSGRAGGGGGGGCRLEKSIFTFFSWQLYRCNTGAVVE